mgnify:CR=1 FL=1
MSVLVRKTSTHDPYQIQSRRLFPARRHGSAYLENRIGTGSGERRARHRNTEKIRAFSVTCTRVCDHHPAAGPAPRNAAKATSRRNPRIRLMLVRPLIRRKAPARDIALIPQPRSHGQTPPAGATGSPRGAPHYAPADHTDLSHRKHRQRVRHKSIP